MSLTIRQTIIANINVSNIFFRPMIGGVEMYVYLEGEFFEQRDVPFAAMIAGADLKVGPSRDAKKTLGVARPVKPFHYDSKDFRQSIHNEFLLPLDRVQVEELEQLRDGQDLMIEVCLRGLGVLNGGRETLEERLNHRVGASDWVDRLRQSGAYESLVVEAPLPIGNNSDEWTRISDAIRSAESHFRGGQYRACIGDCRTALECANDIGSERISSLGWSTLTDRGKREEMNKQQREEFLKKAVFHYTHLAHHGGVGEDWETFSRAEARMILAMTASLISRLHQP